MPGHRIRVVAGAFASCLRLYEGTADRERVAIALDLLGRKVRVVLTARRSRSGTSARKSSDQTSLIRTIISNFRTVGSIEHFTKDGIDAMLAESSFGRS